MVVEYTRWPDGARSDRVFTRSFWHRLGRARALRTDQGSEISPGRSARLRLRTPMVQQGARELAGLPEDREPGAADRPAQLRGSLVPWCTRYRPVARTGLRAPR